MPIALDDVCFNKASIMERCLVRVFEEAKLDPELKSWTHIDALVMNLERACQAAIDLAVHAYQSLNLLIVKKIVEDDWMVFVEYGRELGLRVEPRRE